MEYQIFIVGLCVIAWKDIMQNKVPNSILLILLLLKIVFSQVTEQGQCSL